MTTGQNIDKLVRLRAKRMKLEKQAKEVKAEERALTDEIYVELRDQKLNRATGRRGTFSYKKVAVGKVEDWDAFYKYVKRTNAFELLERRLAQGPLAELGKKPGGVVFENVIKTSLTEKK